MNLTNIKVLKLISNVKKFGNFQTQTTKMCSCSNNNTKKN